MFFFIQEFLERVTQAIGKRVSGKKRILFFHFAKCGGSSVTQSILKHYPWKHSILKPEVSLNAAKNMYNLENPLQDDYHWVFKLQEHILLYDVNQSYRFITGHYCFSEKVYQNFKNDFVFVTMLRDPVRRFISHYFFNKSKRDNSPWKIKLELSDYIKSEFGYQYGHDLVKNIGGLRDDMNYRSQEAIENAKNNLRKFNVLGILEDLQNFQSQIQNICGIKLDIKKTNISPVSEFQKAAMVSGDILTMIKDLSQPDIELYNEAKRIIYSKGQLSK